MITAEDSIRLAAFQQRIFRCIEDELQRDGHHKSYEGAVEVSMSLPNIFETERGISWAITLHCYVLPADGRHHSFSGRTFSEAMALAEAWADKTAFSYEMERFERDMTACDDEDGETDGSVVIDGPPRGWGGGGSAA